MTVDSVQSILFINEIKKCILYESVRSSTRVLEYALLPHDGSSFSGALVPAAAVIVDLLNQLELWNQHGQCFVRYREWENIHMHMPD